MHLVMFDIDGTLIESYDFDSECFSLAVKDVLNIAVDTNWDRYTHVSDAGILRQLIEESAGVEQNDRNVELVKHRFVHHLSEHLKNNEIKEIQGASEFLKVLLGRDDVAVSLATGGWFESAQLKLSAAGIDITDIPLASSSDHYSRVEIMKVSERFTGVDGFESKTYFGDGAWDQQASEALGYEFMLVGDRIKWEPSIEDYTDVPSILRQIGL